LEDRICMGATEPLSEAIIMIPETIKEIIESNDNPYGRIALGQVLQGPVKKTPILWIIPERVSLRDEEIHMLLYDYSVTLAHVDKTRRMQEEPMLAPSTLSTVFQLIKDGIRERHPMRMFIQDIHMESLECLGTESEDRAVITYEMRVKFLIRTTP